MSGSEVSAVHRAFSNLLTTLTPEQVQKFMEEMNASATTTPSLSESVNSTQNTSVSTSKTSTTAMATPEPIETTTRPASRKRTRENTKLRPLNSFIAFRSFYSAAFPDLSQKVKSGLLRTLWGSDPFKAKWAIVAKAYSVIRDKHIGQVTLESFLTLIVPFIGIVSVANYLNAMGLQVVSTEDKQFSLLKTNPNAHINPIDLTTNLSVDDVVHYCYQAGYVSGVHLENTAGNQVAAVSMAVSAQLTPKIETTETTTAPKAALGGSPTSQEAGVRDAASNTNHLNGNGTPQERQLAMSSAPTNDNVSTPHSMNNTTIATAASLDNTRNTGPYTAADFEGELRRAMNGFSYSANDGYYELFNPNLQLKSKNIAILTTLFSHGDHFSNLNKLLKVHSIQPVVSDFCHEPLTLSGKVEIPELEGEFKDESDQPRDAHRSIFHSYISLLEDEANFQLLKQMSAHGPETVYRSAFREYFTGEVTNMMETYWRPDPKGRLIRHQAHELCYQAINEITFLGTAERNMLIRTTGCFPEDTMAFWTSMTKKRLTYLTMKEMAGILEATKVQTEVEEETDIDEMDIDMEGELDFDGHGVA
ncbi:alpha-box mating type protein [Arthroderma uncinatum]|uniref:alpha-box mating type protein n=1 Tax=Arthroderma uncinatum TaxID=74035 RepID=UPI00144A97F5|nr:alpha-box mating type protein [Arthroderma uncinatum]KAF3482311.1 alpha-box mating type protein [Arthroderma uncinatum]